MSDVVWVVPRAPLPAREKKLSELRLRLDVLKREYEELLADRRPRSAGSTNNSFELEDKLRQISEIEKEIEALRDEASSEMQPVTPDSVPEPQDRKPMKGKTATDLMWESVNLAGRLINQKRVEDGKPELTRPQIAQILKENAIEKKFKYARCSVATIERHLKGASSRGRKRKPDK